jgi:diaminopimelate decarboxylase
MLNTKISVLESCNCHLHAKCESTIANLQIMLRNGSDIEVNSGGELYKAFYAGAEGNQIVFNGVGKTVSEIEYPINSEIKSINVDSEFELERVIEVTQKLKKKANVTIRIVPEVSTGVVKGNETGTHESKFGILLDNLEEVIKKAIGCRKELNVLGYNFHIGT